MSCYFRHLKDIFEEVGITVTTENRKQIDRAFHQATGVDYKNCPITWKAIKTIMADEQKRHELIQKLQSAYKQTS
jgi:hypothetical protein